MCEDHIEILLELIKLKYGNECYIENGWIFIGNFHINIEDYLEHRIKLDIKKGFVKFT
jgi:hypothetical protein